MPIFNFQLAQEVFSINNVVLPGPTCYNASVDISNGDG